MKIRVHIALLFIVTLILSSGISTALSLSNSKSISSFGSIKYSSSPPSEVPVLHGINVNSHEQRWEGKNIREELELLKNYGFNAIRFFGMEWNKLTPNAYNEIDEAYFTSPSNLAVPIDLWVQYATELEMYIMLTLVVNSAWQPAPDWSFGGSNPSPRRAWDLMMRGDADLEMESLKLIWVYVTERYADNPYVIIGDFNEPRILEESDLPHSTIAANYKAYWEDLIGRIRNAETVKHVIVIEEYCMLNVPDDIVGDELVYRDIHFYTPWEQPYYPSQYESIRSNFKSRYDRLRTTGLTVQIGEFGRVLHPVQEGSEQWVRDAFRIFDEFNVDNWYYHSYGYLSGDWNEKYGDYYNIIYSDGSPVEPFFTIVTERASAP